MSKKYKSNWNEAFRNFFSTTTLHGRKYLFSKFLGDRIGWLICCCTSTCCAVLLCMVLWARFMEVPAILELWDLHAKDPEYKHMPVVAVCPSITATASILASNITSNSTMAEDITKTLARILSARPTTKEKLEKLQLVLASSGISLSKLVFTHWPTCSQLILRCRWQQRMMSCESLFMAELTPWGICCVMRPNRVLVDLINPKLSPTITTKGLDLALHCSEKRTQGCRLFSTFEVEENVEPMIIASGYDYYTQLRFTSIPQGMIGEACNPDINYTKAKCLAKCAEQACGCLNPLNPKRYLTGNTRSCSLTQLECLRENRDNTKCKCLPSCNKVTTYITLESDRINDLDCALDPIYSELNATASVLHLKVYISLSRIFTMNPTETWLSLLSSLGGVFNMFLGMGFFTALEILVLLFVKLPISFKNSVEIRRSHSEPKKY